MEDCQPEPGAGLTGRLAKHAAAIGAVLLTGLAGADSAFSQFSSTSTTTTIFTGTTTTTMYVPVDVTGGGRFEGSFPAGSFDSYSFVLTEPRVLVAETSNGFGGCPGDTIVELRALEAEEILALDDDSGLRLCSRLVTYLAEPGSYEIRVRAYGGAKLNRYFLQVDFVAIECGNGEIELTEQCDDGNTTGGDCCSPTCRFDEAGAACDNGLFCDGEDHCDAAGNCTEHSGQGGCPGPDGDANCAESCSDEAAGCTAPDTQGSACDDGVFCNGTDRCSVGLCTIHDGDPCLGPDGDSNCMESCDEAANDCTAPDPDSSGCDDNVFCNGIDSCSAGTCTAHQGSPCPGPDGDSDCSESCRELTQECNANDAAGSTCDDEEPCTSSSCDGAGVCVSGDPTPACEPVCGDVGGDGFVTASDALLVLQAAVGGSQCANEQCVCDTNASATVTASDALAVLRHAVGAPAALMCPC